MQIPLHKIDENELFIKWRDIRITPEKKEQAHRHDYYQLMILNSGQGTHEIDFEKYPASSNSLHFVGKGRVHKVDFNTEITGGVLLFPEVIFDNSNSDQNLLASLQYFKGRAYPVLNMNIADFDIITRSLENIKDSLQTQSIEMSRYLLFALLIQIRDIYSKAISETPEKKIAPEIVHFNKLLKKRGTTWNTIEDFIGEMGISSNRLNSLTKEQYGKTALQLLHEKKLLEAKRMIVYTQNQIKEIAYDCGFHDVAYFNRFFKKHTNYTPLAFRKKH